MSKRDPRIHYKPAGLTTVCGAMREAFEAGLKNPISYTQASSDVRRVTCGGCRMWIADVVRAWSEP